MGSIKIHKKFFLILIFLLFWNQIRSLKAQDSSDSTFHLIRVIYQFERFVEEIINEGEAPGVAIAIVKDNKIVYLNGFGVREIGKEDKVDIHTIFRLASVSKGFASVLTGMLAEEGKLSWDEKVTKYFPEFSLMDSRNANHLTIRHILSHTSGLPRHTYTDLVEEGLAFEEMINRLRKVQCMAPVGKVYSYQNVVYSLISNILKSVTGQEYDALVNERIFEPLGMHDASLGKDAFITSANRAMPHVLRNFEWTATDINNAYYNVLPAAGVNASILDMALWLRAMMGGCPDVISPQIIQKITTPVVRTPGELGKNRWQEHLYDAYYGLGWRIYNYADRKLVYHGGWVKGFRAEIGFIPDQRIGMVMLMNAESMAANLFLPTFFDLYLNLIERDAIQSSN